MGKVKVCAFSVSLDGYGAGVDQSMKAPLGDGGEKLAEWVHPTKVFQEKVMGKMEGTVGIDNDFVERSFENIGAWIIGRNMFGPPSDYAQDEEWKGWWGEEPPYHVPVFVLTHYDREPVVMKGGTVFYFLTEGIESAMSKAHEAAGDKDIRIGGGVFTVRQYLQAGLVDELHLAFSPIFLGSGEHLFVDLDLPKLGFAHMEKTQGERALHVVLSKEQT